MLKRHVPETVCTPADEIVLLNGDRFTGTLEKMEDGTLIFKTDYSPPIEIKISEIKSIVTVGPVKLHLSNGEILKGTIVSEEYGQITIAPTDQRSSMQVETDMISAINPPPIRWEGGFTLAGNLQKGNSDTFGASAAFEGVKRSQSDRFSLRYLFNFAEEDDRVIARNHFGAGKYDYFFLRKLYGYLGMDVLNDKFRDIQLRTTIGPGVGYQFWDDNRKAIGVEAGLSYLSESQYAEANTKNMAARLAANLRYTFGTHLILSDRIAYYPSLEKAEANRLRNEAAINVSLWSGWSQRIAYILDYSSAPPDDVKKTDTTVILGLQYHF